MERKESCQYHFADMVRITLPDTRAALPLRKRWWKLKRYGWHLNVLGVTEFASRLLPQTRLGKLISPRSHKPKNTGGSGETLNAGIGEWVEVRSAKEIFGTLDTDGKHRGLRFIPEMVQFCGRRFKIYKRIDKIILEATGELRSIITPTYLLEAVFCDGKAHGGCDRSCFCFWREAWLKTSQASDFEAGEKEDLTQS